MSPLVPPEDGGSMDAATCERRTPRPVISIVAVLGVLAALTLGACGGDSKDAEAVDASSMTASEGGSYSTQAFICRSM
jgi:hypothetical protein